MVSEMVKAVEYLEGKGNVTMVAMPAGTGRLRTAMTKARALADSGKRVLLISDELTTPDLVGLYTSFTGGKESHGLTVMGTQTMPVVSKMDAVVYHVCAQSLPHICVEDEKVEHFIYTQANRSPQCLADKQVLNQSIERLYGALFTMVQQYNDLYKEQPVVSAKKVVPVDTGDEGGSTIDSLITHTW